MENSILFEISLHLWLLPLLLFVCWFEMGYFGRYHFYPVNQIKHNAKRSVGRERDRNVNINKFKWIYGPHLIKAPFMLRINWFGLSLFASQRKKRRNTNLLCTFFVCAFQFSCAGLHHTLTCADRCLNTFEWIRLDFFLQIAHCEFIHFIVFSC